MLGEGYDEEEVIRNGRQALTVQLIQYAPCLRDQKVVNV